MNTELAGGRIRRKQARTGPAEPTSRSAEQAEIIRMAQAEASNRTTERCAMIAEAAYFRAEKRGFEPGHELDDWLAAEVEVANAQQLDTLAQQKRVDYGGCHEDQ